MSMISGKPLQASGNKNNFKGVKSVGAGMGSLDPAIERGLRFLLATQLEDGTWHVRRRAFPFQPTMNSGFPHGRDSWISAAATSWAVLALSLPEVNEFAVSGN